MVPAKLIPTRCCSSCFGLGSEKEVDDDDEEKEVCSRPFNSCSTTFTCGLFFAGFAGMVETCLFVVILAALL